MSDQDGATPAPGTTDAPASGEKTETKTDLQMIERKDVAGLDKADPRVDEARSEAISERKKRQDLEAKLKQYEDAKLTEAQRQEKEKTELATRNGELERELKEERLRTRVASVAVQASVNPRAILPDEVWRLLDLSKVTYDDDGAPKNLERLIEGLKKDRPALFSAAAPGSFDNGPRTDAPPGQGMNDWLRSSARK